MRLKQTDRLITAFFFDNYVGQESYDIIGYVSDLSSYVIRSKGNKEEPHAGNPDKENFHKNTTKRYVTQWVDKTAMRALIYATKITPVPFT